MQQDHEALAVAYWRHSMSSEDHGHATNALGGALDPGLVVLRAIVELLDLSADLYDAASATQDWLRVHRDDGLARLTELAARDRHWQDVLIAVAAFGPKENQRWSQLQDAAARAREARGAPAPYPDYVGDLLDASEARRDTGDRWLTRFEQSNGVERLATAYCLFEVTTWAWLHVFDAARKDPLDAWELIVELARTAPDDESLRQLGAGDVESIIELHGDTMLARIEADAGANKQVRRLLCGVWQTTSMSDALWARIDALVAEFPPEDREGRGQSPQLRELRARGLWKGVPFPGGRERLERLLGEAKPSYSADEIAPRVGFTVDQVRAEIDAGTLYGSHDHGYHAPLVAVLARFFPDVPRDVR